MAKHGHPRRFLDSLRIHIKAGSGGNGMPKYGGVGGKGGDIYCEGVKDLTLMKTRSKKLGKRWKAGDGNTSKLYKIFGDPGKDLIIPAPIGTTVKTDLGQNLGDILNEGDKILVARGGPGGNPDNQFSGQKGEIRHIQLLLKLIADIGLVGFPNAGKSTLLRAISHAKPKVASYPFTTLHPTIGILHYDDQRQISMADLPGLIEGAWKNSGMGHSFLRHVERTKLLLFVIDIEGFRLGPEYPFRSAIENIVLLNRELELYQPELVEKPCVLLFNKMDKPESNKMFDSTVEKLGNIEEFSRTLPEALQPDKFVKFGEILQCSAKYEKDSIQMVKDRLRNLIDVYTEDIDDNELAEIHTKIKNQLYEKELRLV